MVFPVTVIVPVYVVSDQAVDWLGECFQSVHNQAAEVVIWDDGSPYAWERVAHLLPDHAQVYHSSTNKGVSHARNQAVERVRTPLFLPLDCDDRLAQDAVVQLQEAWQGIPVYPDLAKIGQVTEKHYALQNFSPDLLLSSLGIASVNVLQSVDQWTVLNGWNEGVTFFEDCEYNIRLLCKFCGIRYPRPLVEYRIHPNQRTRQYRDQAATIGRKIALRFEGIDMCCGKKAQGLAARTAASKAAKGVQQTMAARQEPDQQGMLPGTQGDAVLVEYIGSPGVGNHYRQGPATGYHYKVVYGANLYVDPSDAVDSRAEAYLSPFIRVYPATSEATPTAPTASTATVERTPVSVPDVRSPVTRVQSLPDIATMVWRDIKNFDFSGLSSDQLAELIRMEEDGKGRVKTLALALVWVVLLGLASRTLRILIRHTDGPWHIFLRLRIRIGYAYLPLMGAVDIIGYQEEVPATFLGELTDCPWCLSTWLTLLLSLGVGLMGYLPISILVYVWLASISVAAWSTE
jgi:hypothetical protein